MGFGQVADIIITDGPKEMSKKGISAFLNNSSKQIGGTGVPPFIVDRFWNESVKHTSANGEEALTFAAWQTEMVFCLKRDITDFTKDIIKEDPSWKYVKAAAPVPVADPVEVAPVDTKEGKRPHGKGKGKGHHGKNHGKNHGKGNHGKKNGTEVEEQETEDK